MRGAGDVNGDSLDDFMITAQYANNYAGEVYLIYGDTGLPGLETIDLGQLGSAGVTIPGSSYSSNFGRGTDAAGDINGDGFDDLILTSQSESDTYAIYGGDNLPLTIEVDHLGTGGVKFTGANTNFAVSGAGDANGDGYDDLLIDDGDYPNAKQTYLVFGGPNLDSTIDLTNLGAGGVAVNDIEPGKSIGFVSRAGDVNGDGFADFLMGGAGDGPNNSRENAGETYLIYGGFDLWNTDAQEVFSESFEIAEWNNVWVEDGQNAWLRSTQRSVEGTWSAEVDGSAKGATLELSNPIDLSWAGSATLMFDWFIEGGFDSGEYLALDISTNGGPWIEHARLEGDQSQEDVWHSELVDLTPYLEQSVKVRFRATVSARNEDANVDNIRIVGVPLNTEPTPGISVSPTAGLLTSETGGTASFDVVLDSQPSADVTIDVSSSDPTEGTVNVSSLTFTPTNWDQPQTILVTGLDDTLEDGDVGYLIITAAAVSSDPDYNGLDPADVAITNLDDDFNYAPVAVDDSATIDQDTQAVIDVLANDSDPEGAPLTIASVGTASSGTVVLNPDQTLTYSPNAAFSGTDSFTYQISDGEKTAQATVTITVRDTTLSSVFVADISFQSRKGDKEWRVNVEVRDENNQPVQGVRVSLTFGSIAAIFITDANGRIQTGWQRISSGSTAEIDTDVSPGGGYVWDQSLYELFGYATGIEDKDGDGRPDKTN